MIRLFGRPNSSNVQKVLWTLDELEVPFELTLTGLSHGGNAEPWYREMNPNGLVPVLVDRGEAIWESNAIVRYLAGAYGDHRLWPADPLERSRADRWMDWQLSTLAPPMATLFRGYVRTPEDRRDPAALAAAAVEAGACWSLVDRHLEGREWLAGDAFGIAEIALGMFAYRYVALVPGRPALPHVDAWYARLGERPAFRDRVLRPLS